MYDCIHGRTLGSPTVCHPESRAWHVGGDCMIAVRDLVTVRRSSGGSELWCERLGRHVTVRGECAGIVLERLDTRLGTVGHAVTEVLMEGEIFTVFVDRLVGDPQ